MATCQQCQFLAPNEATSCPRCHAPFYAVSQFSIYTPAEEAVQSSGTNKKKTLMIGAGVLLVALLGIFLFSGNEPPVVQKRARKEPTDVQTTTVFQAFVPDDGAFRIRVPGKPERSEVVVPELGPTRPIVYYRVEHKEIKFEIEQRVVPRYVPPYEIDQALIEWFNELYTSLSYEIESAKPAKTPAGDYAYDAIVVNRVTGERRYQRMVSWSSNIITLSATWPASRVPEIELIKVWNTMSDSVKQR